MLGKHGHCHCATPTEGNLNYQTGNDRSPSATSGSRYPCLNTMKGTSQPSAFFDRVSRQETCLHSDLPCQRTPSADLSFHQIIIPRPFPQFTFSLPDLLAHHPHSLVRVRVDGTDSRCNRQIRLLRRDERPPPQYLSCLMKNREGVSRGLQAHPQRHTRCPVRGSAMRRLVLTYRTGDVQFRSVPPRRRVRPRRGNSRYRHGVCAYRNLIRVNTVVRWPAVQRVNDGLVYIVAVEFNLVFPGPPCAKFHGPRAYHTTRGGEGEPRKGQVNEVPHPPLEPVTGVEPANLLLGKQTL
jgi:hypothetical protein